MNSYSFLFYTLQYDENTRAMIFLILGLYVIAWTAVVFWPSHRGEDHDPEWVDDPVSLPSCRICGRAM